MLALNPVIQIFKPVSPLAWLPISWRSLTWQTVCHFFHNLSLWPTIINTALGVSSVSKDYIDVARVLEMPRWRRTKISGLPACLYLLAYESVWGWLVIVALKCSPVVLASAFVGWMEPLKLEFSLLVVLVIGLTGLLLDYAVGIEVLVTHRPKTSSS